MKLIQISAGRGPIECSWVVPKVAKEIIKDAKKQGILISEVEKTADRERHTFKSIILAAEGSTISQFLKSWCGTIQWTEQSKFRPNHKRKNWFVSVNDLNISDEIKFDKKDLRIETMRSSGAGGQNVNKVESGVRVTHIPSNISVNISTERSQHRNKKIAMSLIMNKLEARNAEQLKQVEKDNWQNHNELIRGNPIRIFKM